MSDLATVMTFRTRLEAEMAAGLLAEAEIPYLIQSAESTGIVPMPGGASLQVRPEHLAEAVRVLGFPKLERGSDG